MRDKWTSVLPDGRRVTYTYMDMTGIVLITAQIEESDIMRQEVSRQGARRVAPMSRAEVEFRFRDDLTTA